MTTVEILRMFLYSITLIVSGWYLLRTCCKYYKIGPWLEDHD